MVAQPQPRAGLPYNQLAALGVGLLILCAAVTAQRGVDTAAILLVLTAVLAVDHRVALRWEVLLGVLVVIVLAIPIKRYQFAVDMPFDIEPYRMFIAVLVGLWVAALLVDPKVQLRGSVLDRPLLLLVLVVVASVVLNPGTITHLDVFRAFVGEDLPEPVRNPENLPFLDVSTGVTKALLFFVSFLLVYYLIVSVVRTPRAIDFLVRTLVVGGAIVAIFAILERRTGYNVFDQLGRVIPMIVFEGSFEDVGRGGGGSRVYASAQHPIALAALFAMLVPLSGYLAYVRRRWFWYLTTAVIALGAMATVSRTSVTMLAAVAIVFAVLRPVAMKRLWPFLLPVLIAVHLVVPGAIGGLRQSFFPSDGLVSNQQEHGGRLSGKRLGPQFLIIGEHPAFGQGYGTRVTAGPKSELTARILDNQWLATAVETGLLGVAAWAWLFCRFVRRAGREAKRDHSARGWLLTALAAAVVAFAVGMFTYDAFSFIQAMFVMFVLLALGAATLNTRPGWATEALTEPIAPLPGSDGPDGRPAQGLAHPQRQPAERLLTT